MLGSAQDENLSTERVPGLTGRRLRWPRGKGLGGSGRINAMIWTPPTPRDIEMLHQAGGEHWNPGETRAALERVEQYVRPECPRFVSETTKRFIAAAQAWSTQQLASSEPTLYRRTNRLGRRWTTADRLASVASDRLSFVKGHVDRIVYRGDQAIGVDIETNNGNERLHSRLGTILCGGAIATPALLHRSGIGDAAMLRSAGIDCRVDSPRIGEGLKDHLIYPVVFELTDNHAFPSEFAPRELAEFQSVGRGRIVSNLAEAGGTFDDGSIQIHVTPTHYLTYPTKKSGAAMTIGINATRPASCGRVHTTSNGIRIQPNYLDATSDMETMIRGVDLARQIAATNPLSQYLQRETIPGRRGNNDTAVAASIRRYSQTLYHPVGTCTFGGKDCAPLDPQLRVRGVDGLWVVDASVLPDITQTNPSGTLLALCDLATGQIRQTV